LTLVDYPGLVAASVFTQGCNFRCHYCHNRELVIPEYFSEPLAVNVIFDYLSGRQGKLEGVVITGGEPTLQKGLIDFIVQVKKLGFAVKLDTNGSHPEVLSTLLDLGLIDYFALDIKTSLKKYAHITGIACEAVKIKESIGIIVNSGVRYQLRTTLVKGFCSEEDLWDIQGLIGSAKNYILQPFEFSKKMVNEPSIQRTQYTPGEIEMLRAKYERVL